jgi:hypothetical protein
MKIKIIKNLKEFIEKSLEKNNSIQELEILYKLSLKLQK